jgi:hypothetical protein
VKVVLIMKSSFLIVARMEDMLELDFSPLRCLEYNRKSDVKVELILKSYFLVVAE